MTESTALARVEPDVVARVFAVWNAGRSEHTRRARLADLAEFGDAVLAGADAETAAATLLAAGPLGALELANAWNAAMTTAKLRPCTRSRRLSTLRTLVHAAGPFGCAWQLKIRGPRVKKTGLVHGPAIARARAVLAELEAAERWRDLALVLCCFDLSMRTEEAVSLRLEALDLDSARVTFVRKGGGRETRTLTARLVGALRMAIGARAAPGWVFPASRGTGHMNPSTARRLGHKLGIGGLHGLRHTVASAALRAGVPPRAIQKQLGHEHLATTESYLDDMRDDEGAVARWLAGEEEPPP